MIGKFPYLIKMVNIQTQEVQQNSRKMSTKSYRPRHIIVKLLRNKEKILKEPEKNFSSCTG